MTRPSRAAIVALSALAGLVCVPAPAAADPSVRVLTSSAVIRSGPGPAYRAISSAPRGAVLPVSDRATRGYWFRVDLPDGSAGWVYGEQVVPFEPPDDHAGLLTRLGRGLRLALLAPSPVPTANVELAFSAGMLGDDGLFLFRPAWLLDPFFALEGFVGQSPAAQEQVLLAGLGWTLRLIPGAVLGPYLHASVGVEHRVPKADAFALESRTRMAFDAGGGLEITLKKRITLRADYRHWVFFDENQADDAEEVTGGLAIFF